MTPRPDDSELRRTGIRIIGDVPWGVHACIFYDTRRDLLDTCAAWFDAGLKGGEFCVWAVSDPITENDARAALRRVVPDFSRRLRRGDIEILHGPDWYLKGDEFDMQRITGGWDAKLAGALAKGYAGMRVSGNAFWMQTNVWKEFTEYEQELDRTVAGKRMLVLCTYALQASRAVELLDVARAHQSTIVRRKGVWELLETPDLKRAKQEIRKLKSALRVLSSELDGREALTPRERTVLGQIVLGASSKEAARTLRIAVRTVEFHRANIVRKMGAKNTVDLVRKVLGE